MDHTIEQPSDSSSVSMSLTQQFQVSAPHTFSQPEVTPLELDQVDMASYSIQNAQMNAAGGSVLSDLTSAVGKLAQETVEVVKPQVTPAPVMQPQPVLENKWTPPTPSAAA